MRNAVIKDIVSPLMLQEIDISELFQSSPLAALLQTLDGNVLAINPSGCKLLEATIETLKGTDIFCLTQEEITTHLNATLEKSITTKTGHRLLVVLNLHLLKSPEQQEILFITFSDITEIKQKQIELQKLQMLWSHSSDAIFLLEPTSGKIIECNQIGHFYTHNEDHVVKGLGLGSLFPFLPSWCYLFEQLAKHNSYYCQNVHNTKDGIRRVLDLEFHYEHNNNAPQIVVVVRDLTLLKETELKLQNKNQELDTFIYRASHDLKGPLDSIKAVLNYAQSQADVTIAQNYFQMIAECAERLNAGILNLIKTTLITEGDTRLMLSDISTILKNTFSKLKFSPEKEQINLTIYHEHITEEIYTSDEFLSIILQQIIDNCFQFRDLSKPTQEIEVCFDKKGDELYICISDNGIGINEKVIPKVFDMFYRGSSRSKGSGLGLYIVKKAIERLNGRYQLNSIENMGTTFEIWLPIHHL